MDSAGSTDAIYGWGPRSGYVFQKCFVEFFCDGEDLEKLEKRIGEKGSGWVHYFACNYAVRAFHRQGMVHKTDLRWCT